MKQGLRVLVVLAFVLLLGAIPAAAGDGNASDAKQTGPRVDTTSAMVQLKGEPLSTYPKTKPPKAKRSISTAQRPSPIALNFQHSAMISRPGCAPMRPKPK